MDTSIGSVPASSANSAAQAPSESAPREATLGRHLARRLAEVGARDVFTVPGDFNLTLLDELEAESGSTGVRLVGCCNELNAAYAADGYARARGGGVGACAVTFTVGGLSAINAVAGAFSENLPVVCIVGGPNSNDYGSNRILHHTIGLPDFTQELRCFQNVTCYQGRIMIYPRNFGVTRLCCIFTTKDPGQQPFSSNIGLGSVIKGSLRILHNVYAGRHAMR